MYHDRWSDLDKSDLTFRRSQARDPYKGFVMLEPQEVPRPRPAIETVTRADPLLEKTSTGWRRSSSCAGRRASPCGW
ncbi:hypothetical protein AOA80_02895 [Methanomassiliicoccales archaeon RumEn M1]|nr:hypothetical protein AOA80_02895 [Methanomassiliicoccales archaeon RumEn M1]